MEPFAGLIRRPPPSNNGSGLDAPPAPEDFRWVAIWSFLTQRVWEDGTARSTGTMMLFSEHGRLKACLNDRDCEAVAFLTLQGYEEPLDEVEMALRGDNLDWRQMKARKSR